MLTVKEKLNLLNTMEIIETDYDSEGLVYALVDYNENNLEILSQIVPDLNNYLKKYGDPYNEKLNIDISLAAWNYTGAKWCQGDKFFLEKPINEETNKIDYDKLLSELATDENKLYYFNYLKRCVEKYNIDLTEEEFKHLFKLQLKDKDTSWIMHQMSTYNLSFTETLIEYICY